MAQKLFIGGLPFSTDDARLRSAFSEIGEVQSVTVVTDRDTGRSRGFGFIEMATNEAAEQAIARFNGKDFDGRMLKVEKASGTGSARPRGGFGRNRW
jgi:RNA recognition motif-containing protein